MASPTITVAMPGVPAFLQGMTDFLQVSGWLAPHFTLPIPGRSQALESCCHYIATWKETWEFIDSEPSILEMRKTGLGERSIVIWVTAF